MCSCESSDVIVGMEVGVEGMGDGVVGNSVEVVEARFLLCDRMGEDFAVVKEVGLNNVRQQIMLQRRWRDGEAMLLESVVPTGKEALEIAQSVMAVFVVKVQGGVAEGSRVAHIGRPLDRQPMLSSILWCVLAAASVAAVVASAENETASTNIATTHVQHNGRVWSHGIEDELPETLKHTIHTLRANAAVISPDSVWLDPDDWAFHLNQYLRHFNVSPFQVTDNAGPLLS
jgi:hypothetical protein